MKDNLDKVADKIFSYLEVTENFISGQLPDFAKQLIEYSQWQAQWSYDIAFWFCVLFFVLSLILFVKMILSDSCDSAPISCMLTVTGAVFVISFLIAQSSYRDLKMSKIAPKVYFVKTAKDVLKGNN